MSVKDELLKRSSVCELCGSDDMLDVYVVDGMDESILICSTCKGSIENPKEDMNHWHCLNESMWSEVSAVQVVAYRTLARLKDEMWARDLQEMMYLEDEVLEIAKIGLESESVAFQTKDSHGTTLEAGDSVTIIKDLDVKGAGFTAKRGTVVKNISLTSNPEQIEGRVNGVRIVLLSKFLKKA